jgi:Ala-tRNA(Pro) deacylase
MKDVFKVLSELGINYSKFEHGPVKTCAESTAMLPEDFPGVRTKHLFLRDRKRQNYFLLVVDENKLVDLKELSNELNAKSLGMASEEELQRFFNIETGALSMMSLLNLREDRIRFLIDRAIWDEEAFDCHSNVSTTVLSINKEDWIKLFSYMKIEPEIIPVPQKYD